ncbi:MAG: type II toxin-antitoxin system RelE/ParE family toxin [Anaerolineae bacterium]|nr:type II toxin-antitoxin system RelE/ParE family toxin [Anaerolineae bacterium]
MPNEGQPSVKLRFTPEFKRNLRALSKKYRRIRSDVQPVIDQLQAGNFVGDQIPRVKYTIFKLRVKNSDIGKGKRSGYRFIYYLKTQTEVILVTIYSKLEQSDISAEQIRRILQEFETRGRHV